MCSLTDLRLIENRRRQLRETSLHGNLFRGRTVRVAPNSSVFRWSIISRGKALDGSCFGCQRGGAVLIRRSGKYFSDSRRFSSDSSVVSPSTSWQSFVSQRLLERWSMDVLSDVAFSYGLCRSLDDT